MPASTYVTVCLAMGTVCQIGGRARIPIQGYRTGHERQPRMLNLEVNGHRRRTLARPSRAAKTRLRPLTRCTRLSAVLGAKLAMWVAYAAFLSTSLIAPPRGRAVVTTGALRVLTTVPHRPAGDRRNRYACEPDLVRRVITPLTGRSRPCSPTDPTRERNDSMAGRSDCEHRDQRQR